MDGWDTLLALALGITSLPSDGQAALALREDRDAFYLLNKDADGKQIILPSGEVDWLHPEELLKRTNITWPYT